MECLESSPSVAILFVVLAGLLTVLVARHNRFGIKDAVLASIGRKSFERTPLINVVNILALTVPLGLTIWIIQTCGA